VAESVPCRSLRKTGNVRLKRGATVKGVLCRDAQSYCTLVCTPTSLFAWHGLLRQPFTLLETDQATVDSRTVPSQLANAPQAILYSPRPSAKQTPLNRIFVTEIINREGEVSPRKSIASSNVWQRDRRSRQSYTANAPAVRGVARAVLALETGRRLKHSSLTHSHGPEPRWSLSVRARRQPLNMPWVVS
jgi:hypothetical protein